MGGASFQVSLSHYTSFNLRSDSVTVWEHPLRSCICQQTAGIFSDTVLNFHDILLTNF